MKVFQINIRNFRRLVDVELIVEEKDTVLVGPNNSGKTSVASALRRFFHKSRFSAYDFNVEQMFQFENAVRDNDDWSEIEIPSIEFDLWVTIDPTVEYGRVFSLLSSTSAEHSEIGVRVKFQVADKTKLISEYELMYPLGDAGSRSRGISHFLSINSSTNLSKHFECQYFALEKSDGAETESRLRSEEGRRILESIVRVDFVDAQRGIDDKDDARSGRLSNAFAEYFRHNLNQPDQNIEANRIIDENNESLTTHYGEHFAPLISVIGRLGFPSLHDRKMKIVSTLNPEEALRGSTDLLYVDEARNHHLPEYYNGLGFKNLIYMAIQVSHYHSQWMTTMERRELCQLIVIEEPEVHLHAQVQQAFIKNIWNIVEKASSDRDEAHMIPQLMVSTHSSHILEAAEFRKIRHFQRCTVRADDESLNGVKDISRIVNLRDFDPDPRPDGEGASESDTIKFLDRYLKLTHCDLFFADAAVLVEGTVEKLLLPKMIQKVAPDLKNKYLSILEVGGAYAHRFAGLLQFLNIPYLVITDIDSVNPANNRTTCRPDLADAKSSNGAFQHFFQKTLISEILAIQPEDQVVENGNCYVGFQRPSEITSNGETGLVHGRTFEESFVFENRAHFLESRIASGIPDLSDLPINEIWDKVHEKVSSSNFKKTEFALSIATSDATWATPDYIKRGLLWLEGKLKPDVSPDTQMDTAENSGAET